MALRGLVRLAVAGALACLLSACWMADKELIPEKAATTIAFTGSYHADGEGEQDKMDLRIGPDGGKSYLITSDGDESIPMRFLALRGDWYLMQYEGHSDEEGTDSFFIYIVLKTVGSDLQFYASDCDELEGTFKGMKREESAIQTCNFSRLDGLKSAALAYIDRLEKGEAIGDPKVLRRVGTP